MSIQRRWLVDCEHEHHIHNMQGEPEGQHDEEFHYAWKRVAVYERLAELGWKIVPRMAQQPEGLICPSCTDCDLCAEELLRADERLDVSNDRSE